MSIITVGKESYDATMFRRRVNAAVDQDMDSKVEYACRQHIANLMRRTGFRFRPVFRDNKKQPSHNRCDYTWKVSVVNRHLKVEIVI